MIRVQCCFLKVTHMQFLLKDLILSEVMDTYRHMFLSKQKGPLGAECKKVN